jgi:phage-related tail fiber protein
MCSAAEWLATAPAEQAGRRGLGSARRGGVGDLRSSCVRSHSEAAEVKGSRAAAAAWPGGAWRGRRGSGAILVRAAVAAGQGAGGSGDAQLQCGGRRRG